MGNAGLHDGPATHIRFCDTADTCIEFRQASCGVEILRKLNAAKGGGLIFQSDHSVTSSVSGRTYDYIVNLIRKHGTYPLDLGEFDEHLNAAT